MMTEQEQNKKLDELEGSLKSANDDIDCLNKMVKERDERIQELTDQLENAENVIEDACAKLRYYER